MKKPAKLNLNAKMTRDIDVNKATWDDLLKWYNENSGESKPRTTLGDDANARKLCSQLKQAILDLSSGSSKEAAKKKAAKAAAKKGSDESKSRGRKSNFSGKFIYRHKDHKDKNPRREGTHGHKSFALIKDGMTYEDYIEKGGRPNDLAWDVSKKFVEVVDKKR